MNEELLKTNRKLVHLSLVWAVVSGVEVFSALEVDYHWAFSFMMALALFAALQSLCCAIRSCIYIHG